MDHDNPPTPAWTDDPGSEDEVVVPVAPVARPVDRLRKSRKATIVGSLLVGGVAGAAILGPLAASAASPTPTATTAPGTTGGSGTTGDADHGPGMGFGHTEAVTDTSVVAKAIGMTEADLISALQGGQTVAEVAKAKGVDVQKVIDALVADGMDELAAEVKAGTITQAQADAMKAEVTQRATDQVNGTLMGGKH
jgi:hypothetical protein